MTEATDVCTPKNEADTQTPVSLMLNITPTFIPEPAVPSG